MNSFKPLDKTYSFDLDGNIAHLNTPVLLEKQQEDGSRKLMEILAKDYDHNPLYADRELYRPLDNDFEKAHMHARDSYKNDSHRGVVGLQDDVVEAIMGKEFGPSFYRLLFDVWMQGRMFSINTARGHTSENIKNAIYKVLLELLSPQGIALMAENIKERYKLVEPDTDKKLIWWYLDHNMYYGGANIELRKQHMISHMTNSALIKTVFQDNYIHYLHNFSEHILHESLDYPVKMGFSDDGYENTRHMLEYFLTLQQKEGFPYDNMKFRLYFTGKHLDVVQKNMEEEIVKILGSTDGIIIEQKQHSLGLYHKELNSNGESIFNNEKHNYDDTIYKSLKIML